MGKAMSEEAKARLRVIAEEKRGRATLKGLDPAGWGAALDAIQDGDERIQFPAPTMIAAGYIFGPNIANFRWTYSRDESGHDKRQMPRTAYHQRVAYVRLKHATEQQNKDVVRWLGAACVPIVERVFGGPGDPRKATALFLYPVAPMLRLMHAIWPGERDDWQGKAAKYLHGYSAAWVRRLSPWVHGFDAIPNQPEGWLAAVEERRHASAVNELGNRGLLFDVRK